MLAVVKKPRTEKTLFSVKGEIPHKVIDYLKKEFGSDFEVPEGDEDVVNIFDTAWYKDIRSITSSGDVLKIYRENIGLTREELGKELGEFSAQEIADMEDGKSVISRGLAEKLSHFFEVHASRFHL